MERNRTFSYDSCLLLSVVTTPTDLSTLFSHDGHCRMSTQIRAPSFTWGKGYWAVSSEFTVPEIRPIPSAFFTGIVKMFFFISFCIVSDQARAFCSIFVFPLAHVNDITKTPISLDPPLLLFSFTLHLHQVLSLMNGQCCWVREEVFRSHHGPIDPISTFCCSHVPKLWPVGSVPEKGNGRDG